MLPRFKRSLSLILLSLAVSEASATQFVEKADRGHVQVLISAKETNRLAIEGRRIASIVPSDKGALSGQKDETGLGAFYFTLASDAHSHGTLTLFVSDENGVTYKLLLVPRPMAGEEIIIRPPAEPEKIEPVVRTDEAGRALSYQRRIKELMLVMADQEQNSGIQPVAVNREVPLWKEGRLVMLSTFTEGDLVGEKYLLTNVSPAPMLLVEQELYRRGVRAVAIDHHTLAQGESTEIFIVRERRGNE